MNRIGLLTVIFAALTVVACRKKGIQPVITLNGSPEQTISLGQAYVESGATAQDNKDGDISEFITISGNVNKDLAGDYRVFYNVEDNEGNKAATATRFVKVVNDADFMIGTYEATPSCLGTETTDPYFTTITASDKVNNQVFIRRVLIGVEDQPVVATITNNGGQINIEEQTIGNHTVSGVGLIDGGNFTLSTDINGDITYDCAIEHVKQ